MTDAQHPVVLLTGATGFVGSHVQQLLADRGWTVRCGSRRPDAAAQRYPDRDWVRLDVDDGSTMEPALAGVEAAIYLVHGMAEEGDYEQREHDAARAFARVAARAGVRRLVYLGGVEPAGELSKHLRSRLETGRILREEFPGTVELRAGMIVGSGSESWQICRDLAARLPFMVLPRWLESRSQPVAIADVATALASSLDEAIAPGWYDIPGAETLSAREILMRIARLRGLAPFTVSVPVITPKLSSYWLRLVTRANYRVAVQLVEGLRSDLVATGTVLWDLLEGFEPTSFDDAIRAAMAEEPPAAFGTRLLENAVRTLGPKPRTA